MHPCLIIDEILQNILGRVDDKALYSVSLVCRAFLDPANDELWADLPGLSPLIKCLPRELLGASRDYEKCLTVVRPPLPSELYRFDHYARRVKYLSG
ncbi:F-box protein [Phanerochaete sordida]|uniref:F-box protein n=1 Tax=Phanerochaete sordida TaxID=48140 RepID=A0A9P3LM78_9APHY|nr:F-box protein [Phanerochaete sordida]